ncbi:MAG: carotenoid biosynthesis protein [Candidatus Helarchaeota archaeon]
MFELLLVIPLSIFFILMIINSIIIDGLKNSFLFFGYATIYSFIREFVINSIAPLYEGSGNLKIGNVSLIIVFGWIFTFYLANYFANQITKKTKYEHSIFTKTCIGTFLAISISLVMETSAIQLGWWHWRPELLGKITPSNSLFGAPYFVFIGWGITGFVFLFTYYLIKNNSFSIKNLLIICLLDSLMLINFIVGNSFILNPPPIIFNLFYSFIVQSIILILLYHYYNYQKKNIFITIILIILIIWMIFNSIIMIIYTSLVIIVDMSYIYQLLFEIIVLLYFIYLDKKLIQIYKNDFNTIINN